MINRKVNDRYLYDWRFTKDYVGYIGAVQQSFQEVYWRVKANAGTFFIELIASCFPQKPHFIVHAVTIIFVVSDQTLTRCGQIISIQIDIKELNKR